MANSTRGGGEHFVLAADRSWPGQACESGVRQPRVACGLAELFVDAQGFFELVFEDDDAAGGVDGGALVDEVAGAHGDAQLVAGVAAVAAVGAQGGDEALVAEGAQEAGVVPVISAARPMV